MLAVKCGLGTYSNLARLIFSVYMKVRFHASKSTASVLLMFSSVNSTFGDFPADNGFGQHSFANNNIRALIVLAVYSG